MELLWPIIRQQLLGGICTRGRPELKSLRLAGESYEAWRSVPADELLVRWVNYHVGEGSLRDFNQDKVRGMFGASCVCACL